MTKEIKIRDMGQAERDARDTKAQSNIYKLNIIHTVLSSLLAILMTISFVSAQMEKANVKEMTGSMWGQAILGFVMFYFVFDFIMKFLMFIPCLFFSNRLELLNLWGAKALKSVKGLIWNVILIIILAIIVFAMAS